MKMRKIIGIGNRSIFCLCLLLFLFIISCNNDIYREKTIDMRISNEGMLVDGNQVNFEKLDKIIRKLASRTIITVNVIMSDDVSYEHMMYYLARLYNNPVYRLTFSMNNNPQKISVIPEVGYICYTGTHEETLFIINDAVKINDDLVGFEQLEDYLRSIVPDTPPNRSYRINFIVSPDTLSNNLYEVLTIVQRVTGFIVWVRGDYENSFIYNYE